MAGVTIEMLIPALDVETLAAWNRVVDSMSTMRTGYDFWVAPIRDDAVVDTALPFFWKPMEEGGLIATYRDSRTILSRIEDAFGCDVGAAILIGAMCRGRASDHILARLCVGFMKGRSAVLAFDGLLTLPISIDRWREWQALTPSVRSDTFIGGIGAFPGRIVALPDNEEPTVHIVDMEFLKFWCEHPAFHFPN